jgi:hypothetical protein
MSALYTQSSLPDSKLVSEEEQGKQNESFETLQELKGRSEKFKN